MDPEWTDGKRRYEWNKRIREYYARHKLYTKASAGEAKRVRSPFEWYRRVKKRIARVIGIAPADFDPSKRKTPRNKGNAKAQRARARVRARASVEGRSRPKSNTAHVFMLRDWVRQLRESIATTTDPETRGRFVKQRDRLRADIKRITGKQ